MGLASDLFHFLPQNCHCERIPLVQMFRRNFTSLEFVVEDPLQTITKVFECHCTARIGTILDLTIQNKRVRGQLQI